MPGDFQTPEISPGQYLFDLRNLLIDTPGGYFNWTESGTGGDDFHSYNTDAAWTGATGIRMNTRMTSAAIGDNLALHRLVSRPRSDRVKIGCRLTFTMASRVKYWTLKLGDFDGTNEHLAALRWEPGVPIWQYLDSAGSYQNISALDFPADDNAWINVELAIDVGTKKYISATVNGIHVDLSDYQYDVIGADTSLYLRPEFYIEAGANAYARCNIDMPFVSEYLSL